MYTDAGTDQGLSKYCRIVSKPDQSFQQTILDVDIAKEILDRSISVEEDAYAKAGFATYDYELLEDSYSQWKPSKISGAASGADR